MSPSLPCPHDPPGPSRPLQSVSTSYPPFQGQIAQHSQGDFRRHHNNIILNSTFLSAAPPAPSSSDEAAVEAYLHTAKPPGEPFPLRARACASPARLTLDTRGGTPIARPTDPPSPLIGATTRSHPSSLWPGSRHPATTPMTAFQTSAIRRSPAMRCPSIVPHPANIQAQASVRGRANLSRPLADQSCRHHGLIVLQKVLHDIGLSPYEGGQPASRHFSRSPALLLAVRAMIAMRVAAIPVTAAADVSCAEVPLAANPVHQRIVQSIIRRRTPRLESRHRRPPVGDHSQLTAGIAQQVPPPPSVDSVPPQHDMMPRLPVAGVGLGLAVVVPARTTARSVGTAFIAG